MKKNNLGCLTPISLLVGLLTLLVIGGISSVQGGTMFSPGDLSAASGQALGGFTSHEAIGGQCGACHTAPWSPESMTTRCLDCHTQVQSDLTDPSTLHGGLVEEPGQVDCRACHTEHHGPQATLTYLDTIDFPHDVTGYSLLAHASHAGGQLFVCEDCHITGLSEMETSVCADCHEQLDAVYMHTHSTAFGMDCMACHDGIDTFGSSFSHDQTSFPLAGRHTEAACQGCHDGSTTLQQLSDAPQDCAACHNDEDAHAGNLGADCASCHTPDGWEPATFDHAQTRFALLGMHQEVECSECHQDNTFQNTPADCAACHQEDDAHNGELGSDCAACHTAAGWIPAEFDHNQSSFPLTGAHQAVPCLDCHADRAYQGTPATCIACHSRDDEHNGQFGTDCSACHTTASWSEVTFDHANTNFPLTGAHTGLPCLQCHSGGVFKDTPTQCSACHSDPAFHAGLFGADCAACHNTTAWQPASYNGPHTFPRNHGDANTCRDCHPSSLAGWTCYTCHNQSEVAEEHNEEGIGDFSNCLRCHADGREGDDDGGDGGDDDD